MNKTKEKKRAAVLDLAQSILIYTEVHAEMRNFHPGQLAKHFNVTVGAIRTAMRELTIQGKIYQQHARDFFDRGPSKGGWLKHVFTRRRSA